MRKAFVAIGTALMLAMCAACSSPERDLAWNEGEGHRWAALDVEGGSRAGFRRLPASESGLAFTNVLTEEHFLLNRHYMNGSGVAVGDVDGDAWPDLYFARLEGPNALYLNRTRYPGGPLRFEEAPDAGGAALDGQFSTGALLEDVDGDADLDLVVTAMGGGARLLLNDGAGRFEEATEQAGIGSESGATTLAMADVDGDGDLDLYVAQYKRRTVKDIYPPDVRGFERVVVKDGDTYRIKPEFEDHYLLRIRDQKLMRLERAEPDALYLNGLNEGAAAQFEPVSFTGGAFVGDDGAPLDKTPEDWALVARLQDLNGDGRPDLYLCNDFESPDRLWINIGAGADSTAQQPLFRAASPVALRTTSHSTMSVAVSDVDLDGDVDFFLADMLARSYEGRKRQMGTHAPLPEGIGAAEGAAQEMRNTLQLARGDGTYAEAARMAGVEASGWSWASVFVDVDLDGWEDLLITNGHVYDAMHSDTQTRIANINYTLARDWRKVLLEFPPLRLKNAAFRNLGGGRFEEVEDGWGIGEGADISHGLALGDLDKDGDLDAVANRMNEEAGLYENEAAGGRVAVRLRGRNGNRRGIGANVLLRGNGIAEQQRTIISGGQYLSGSEAVVAFGVPETAPEGPMELEVRWPSGAVSRVADVHADRLYEIYEPERAGPEAPSQMRASTDEERISAAALKDTASADAPAQAQPYFEEVPGLLDHKHHEEPYDDFARQPLLPRRLSQQGPAAAWADLDGDGGDDLLIGGGRGGALAYYRNDGGNRLAEVTGSAQQAPLEKDQAGIVVLPQAAGGALVLVGRSNYERRPDDTPEPSEVLVYKADRGGLRLQDRLEFGPSAIGPLALGDLDGDGDLDLFAGGRHMPGRYPESASSHIYINEGDGRFRLDPERSAPFRNLGMVSGAALGDLDGDADADLALATEWGPVRYFENAGDGRFADATAAVGLDARTGWWNGVAMGDLDGDGRLDLVATNWGWNSSEARPPAGSAALAHPLRLYYADFDRNGLLDMIEARYVPHRAEYLPERGLSALAFAMPYVRRRVQSFEQYASASLSEIAGPGMAEAPYHEVGTLAHTAFLNRAAGSGLRFEARPLPEPAQMTAAFAPTVADYDGDGNEDVFLSQNFFAVQVEASRLDAGRGLWLRGDGTGGLEAVPGGVTGVRVYGEQRAAPVADFDEDGRIDLAVTQNGAATKLYRNVQARPGLRVRLAGPPANPMGVGATVRLRYAGSSQGPARLVAAGAGYWTQSTLVPVMGHGGQTVEAVEVRWPDGSRTQTPVPENATEVTAAFGGGT